MKVETVVFIENICLRKLAEERKNVLLSMNFNELTVDKENFRDQKSVGKREGTFLDD